MGDFIKGLTIRFGGEYAGMVNAMRGIRAAAKATNSELSLIKKALKFDPSSTTAAARRVDLLGEQAKTAAMEAETLKRRIRELSRTKVEGTAETIGSLSAKLKDSASASKIATERYNQADAALERFYDGLRKAANGSGKFKEANLAAIEALKKGEININQFTSRVRNMGDATKGVKKRFSELKAAWHEAFDNNETLKSVQQLRRYQDELIKVRAQMKSIARERVEAATARPYSAWVANAKQLKTVLEATEAEARTLQTAMRDDPDNKGTAARYMANLKSQVSEASVQVNLLRKRMDQLDNAHGARVLAEQSRNLGVQLQAAKERAAGLEAEFAQLTAQENYSEQRAGQLRATLERVYQEIKKLGAAQEYRELAAQCDYYTAKANKAAEATRKISSAVAPARGGLRQLGLTLYSTLTPAVMMAAHYAVSSAEDIDAAYRNMRKTVQGAEDDFEHLREAALEYSRSHYTSADDILNIEAIGGQLGIAVSDLEAFSTVISNLNIATNIEDAEELSIQLAKLANITGLTVGEYDNFGDALVRLGNNEPALESDIMAIATRFGGMGSIVEMSADQILAWATAATATGQKAEAAGGSLQRTIGRIEGAVAKGGDKLEAFAEVAGMSAGDFADKWNTDASGALQAFVEGLARINDEGGSVDGTLQDLGITGVRDRQLLEGLTNTTDVLRESLVMSADAFNGVGDEWGQAGDAAREADRKCQGFSGTIQVLRNNAQQLFMAMGDSLTPVLRNLTDMVQGFMETFMALPDGVKTAVTMTIGSLAALGPMLTFGVAISESFGTVIQGLGTMRGAFSALAKEQRAVAFAESFSEAIYGINYNSKAATKALYTAEGAAKAFARVPTGALLAGLAAIAAVVYLIASHFAEVNARNETFSKATTGLADTVGAIKTPAEAAAASMDSLAESMNGVGRSALELRDDSRSALERLASLSDTIGKSFNDADIDASTVQVYADTIERLAGKCREGTSDLAELKAAVEKYNELTGSSISITDETTGAIDMNTEAFRKNTEAAKLNAFAKASAEAEAQLLQEKLQAQKDYAEAVQKSADAQDALNKMEEYFADTPDAKYQDVGYKQAAEDVENAKEAVDNYRVSLESSSAAYDTVHQKTLDYTMAMQGDQQAMQRLKFTLTDYMDALKSANLDQDEFVKATRGMGDDLDTLAADMSGAGISAQQFAKIGAEGFSKLRAVAGDDMSAIGTLLNGLNAIGIDPKTLNVTTDGITTAEGELVTFDAEANRILIGDHPYKITVEGATDIEAAANAAEQADGSEVNVDINANDQATPVLEQIEGEDLDDEEFEVSAEDNATEVLEQIDAEVPEDKDLNITATVDDQATSTIDAINSQQVDQKEFSVVAKDEATETIGKINDAKNSLSDKSVYISVAGGALSAINSIQSALNNLTTYKEITIKTIETKEKRASGGLLVPMNMAGGTLNGIVTRAALTSAGIVGEAGAEAVFNMGGRGSAIVPLDNKKYVRPFARAVADEMGAGVQPSQTTVMNVYIDGRFLAGGVDESTTLGDLAKGLRQKHRS